MSEPEQQRVMSRLRFALLCVLGGVLGIVGSTVLPSDVWLAAVAGWCLGYFGRDWERRRWGA